MSLLNNRSTVNELEDWSMKIPEDVFHLGQLSYKIKGSYKYQTKWAVLRFESAMGPKRLELFEVDTKDKCFQINANIYPTITIPFTQLLGFCPQHTMRPGIFPIQAMMTSTKHQLAAKTKEEQQLWLTKLNTLVYGSPRPNRNYEYIVMVFPTKISNEMNLRGSYIFRVAEHSVYLISREMTDHMTYAIPLYAIIKANHTVFSNSSEQFSPYSDRKSNIKALALTIDEDCDLKKGGYVFAATSAAEIAAVINRRSKSCNCHDKPNSHPIQPPPTTTDEELLAGSPMPPVINPPLVKSHPFSPSSLTLPALTMAAPNTTKITKARTLNRSLSSNSTALVNITVGRSPSPKAKSKALQITVSQHSNSTTTDEEYTSPQTTPKLQGKLPHPKRKFSANYWNCRGGKETSPLHSPVQTSPATPVKNSPAYSVNHNRSQQSQPAPAITPNLRDMTPQRSGADFNSSEHIPKVNTTLVVVDQRSPSRLSSSSSPDSDSSSVDQYSPRYPSSNSGEVADKISPRGSPNLSPQTSPPPPPHSAPYVNLECLLCSKTHHWDNDRDERKKDLLLLQNSSCPRYKRRSRSMGSLVGQLTSAESALPQRSMNLLQHCISQVGTHDSASSKSELHHQRSYSSDKTYLIADKQISRKESVPSLATHAITKSCEITPSKNSATKATNLHNHLYHRNHNMACSYESIASNGPYELVHHRNLSNTILDRPDSNGLPRAAIRTKVGGGSLHSVQTPAQGGQGGYKSIKESGPYERAHYASDPALVQELKSYGNVHVCSEDIKRPQPKPRPVHRPRKQQLSNHHSTATYLFKSPKGNYESILKTADSVTLGKRSDSLGDLLDIRDSSEMYSPHTGTTVPCHAPLKLDCSSPIVQNHEDMQQYQHHVLNLHSPPEYKGKNSPKNKALPYAVLWFNRT